MNKPRPISDSSVSKKLDTLALIAIAIALFLAAAVVLLFALVAVLISLPNVDGVYIVLGFAGVLVLAGTWTLGDGIGRLRQD